MLTNSQTNIPDPKASAMEVNVEMQQIRISAGSKISEASH